MMAPSLSPAGARATIHRIISTFDRAFTALQVQVKPFDLERCSVLVHEGMSGRSRLFHRTEHVFDVAAGTRDPLETLAILFHDVVYVQVDGALSSGVASLIGGAMNLEGGDYRVGAVDQAHDPVAHLVFRVFGVTPGQTLVPAAGLSEVLSALVAARQLSPMLPPASWVQVVACIEATIAFRGADVNGKAPFDRLADRLAGLRDSPLVSPDDWNPSVIAEAVHRAVRVANGDVGNFADGDPASFLDQTWKLLPELNPALQAPASYTVRQYRIALGKMEAFLAALAPPRVFHQWREVPAEAEYRACLAAAQRNLDIAVRYLHAKLYATALLEAIALVSGGDAPLELFTGALRLGPDELPTRRIDDLLSPPDASRAGAVDTTLLRLLGEGRTSETSFDLRASPIAAYLIGSLGESHVHQGVNAARTFFEGSMTPLSFLRSQRSPAVDGLILAVAEMAVTRRDVLRSIAADLAASPHSVPSA